MAALRPPPRRGLGMGLGLGRRLGAMAPPPLRPPQRPLLLPPLLLLMLLLGSAEAAAEALDFGVPGQPTVTDSVELVAGEMAVKIKLNWYNIADFAISVRNALQGVAVVATPVVLTTYQYMANFNPSGNINNPAELHMKYYILPHGIGANVHEIREKVDAAARSGGFQAFLAWQVKQDPKTAFIDTTSWEIVPNEPTVITSAVLRPLFMPDPPKSQTEALATALVVSGSSKIVRCASAESGCMCAAMVGCLWLPSGVRDEFNCSNARDPKSFTDVPCVFCAMQNKCANDPEPLCRVQKAACSCATSKGDCFWNATVRECAPRRVEYTPCPVCPSQDRCGPPVVRSVSPASGSIVGVPARRKFDILFDRQVTYLGKEGDIVFQCWQPEVGAKAWNVPASLLESQGPLLRVNAAGMVNHSPIPCYFSIKERVFRDDDGAWYRGMLPGDRYAFTLGDTVKPFLEAVAPADGEELKGDLPTMVALNFSEPVRLSSMFVAELVLLWGGKERLLHKWEGPTDEGVTVNDSRLFFDLRSIEAWGPAGASYSLVLYEDAVADSVGNLFAGLALGRYSFRQSISSSKFFVSFALTVANVDYEFLISDEKMVANFTTQVKEAIAAEAGIGVAPENVQVRLARGSVRANCIVAVANQAAAQQVQLALETAKALAEAITGRIVGIRGISTISTGAITVSGMSAPQVVDNTNRRSAVLSRAPEGRGQVGLLLAAVLSLACAGTASSGVARGAER